MKLQSNITGEIKDWSFSEWLHYIIHSEGKAGEACDVKDFIERVEKFRNEWEENPKEAWFINPQGEVENWPDTEWAEDWTREKEIGNYFETKEEAEKAVEKLKAWKRLKDKDFQFHGHNALGCGEITFSLNFEDMDDEGEIGQLRHDLDLLFRR